MPNDIDDLRETVGDTDWREVGREILSQAAAQVGGSAVSKFMRTGGTGAPIANNQRGPGTLRRRTGRLARSLTGARSAQTSASALRGAPEGVFDLSPTQNGVRLTYGSEVDYAAVHEYGTSQTVSVNQHTRRQTQAFGRELDEPQQVTVRAHSRQMNMPERPYLRPALKEKLGKVEEIAETEALRAIVGRGDD